MKINNKIRDENLQCHINREVVKISALWLGKIDKYDYLMGKTILASVPSQINQQAKLTKSILRKAFKKQTKMIMDQGDKQIEAAVKQREKQLATLNDVDIYANKKDKFLFLKQKEIFNEL